MPSHWTQDAFTAAARFAAEAHHRTQALVPGTRLPYFYHVVLVAMETTAALAVEDGHGGDLAVQCALLHDVLEDTPATAHQLAAQFGPAVTAGVRALTKNTAIADKSARMRDSLNRIRRQPSAVWVVKLADRIVNLQPPPLDWDDAKVARYRLEAQEICDTLGAASPVLADRLAGKIRRYGCAG